MGYVTHVTYHIIAKSLIYLDLINTLASAEIRGYSKKKRLNARGFVQEFLRSGMLYRPGRSLKRLGKSSSLHSKKNFLLGDTGFLLVMS